MCKRMMSFPVSHYHNKPCDKIKIEEIEPDDTPDDTPDELYQEPKKECACRCYWLVICKCKTHK